MGLFPQQFIDDLRQQANIVQVVSEYVPLRRVGATYKGLCPFHSEKTPSFHVNPDRGFFHCFGCGAGGDVFKFLELHEKLDFPEAVRILAQKTGISLPEPVDGGSDDARRDAALREALLKAHEVAAAYFREQLAGAAGARARQQLAERGVSSETVEKLGIGYAPPARDGLRSRLLKQGFAEGVLLQSGLLVQRDGPAGSRPDVVDRFRNRLMIPICRDTGSVIAFGGRSMEADQQPKYLNSPETPIYSKGRTLYGLNLTKSAIRKAGFVVLVEGYFDFAQVFQADAAPAVASCGTALTEHQAQVLRRFTTKVVLSFDPDAAGQQAAVRSCELLVKAGFDVNVVVLNKGEDPDTFIRRHGGDTYRARLRTSRPYLEYVVAKEAAVADFRSGDGRNGFLLKMKGFADMLPDDASKERFAETVAFRAGVTDETVVAQFRKDFRSKNQGRRTVLPDFGNLKAAERDLIWALVNDTPSALHAIEQLEPEDFEHLASWEILGLAQTLHGEGPDQIPMMLLERLSNEGAQLVRTISTGITAAAPPLACVQSLRRLRWQAEQAAIQREIDRLQQLGATQHEHEIDNLWLRKKDLLHRIEQLT